MALSKRNTRMFSCVLFICSALATTAALSAQTLDRDKRWTTVGSTGTVDEADVRKVFFDRGVVQMGRIPTLQHGAAPTPAGAKKSVAQGATFSPSESAVVRYNVVPVEGLFAVTTGRGIFLTLRYLDEGPAARVVAKLIAVNLTTGSETTILTLDSDLLTSAKGYQTGGVNRCNGVRFDFNANAYYVEATLTHSSLIAASASGIQAIQIGDDPCIDQ